MDKSENEIIECRPTKWFYVRSVVMVGMFAVFLVLFIKDWKIGWPRKNEVYYTFQAFKEAPRAFREHEEAGRGAEEWRALVASKKIDFPKEEGVLPAGVEPEASWPEILRDYDGYKKALESEGNKAIPPLWARYTDERGWSSGTPAKAYDQKKIDGQLYMGIASGALLLVGLFFLVRTSRRSMKVDGEAYYAPDGRRIAFDEIRRIDQRKWGTKGLAYLYYGEGGAAGKAKVDGMVYGHFKEEDGAPAEQLFQRILRNFSGELVELEGEEDDEVPERGSEEGAESSGEDGDGKEGRG